MIEYTDESSCSVQRHVKDTPEYIALCNIHTCIYIYMYTVMYVMCSLLYMYVHKLHLHSVQVTCTAWFEVSLRAHDVIFFFFFYGT